MPREQSIILKDFDPLVRSAQFKELQSELDAALTEEAMLHNELRSYALNPAEHREDIIACNRAITTNKKRILKAQEDIKCLNE